MMRRPLCVALALLFLLLPAGLVWAMEGEAADVLMLDGMPFTPEPHYAAIPIHLGEEAELVIEFPPAMGGENFVPMDYRFIIWPRHPFDLPNGKPEYTPFVTLDKQPDAIRHTFTQGCLAYLELRTFYGDMEQTSYSPMLWLQLDPERVLPEKGEPGQVVGVRLIWDNVPQDLVSLDLDIDGSNVKAIKASEGWKIRDESGGQWARITGRANPPQNRLELEFSILLTSDEETPSLFFDGFALDGSGYQWNLDYVTPLFPSLDED